jgi:hypothetical protein
MRRSVGLAVAALALGAFAVVACAGDDTVAPNPGRDAGNDATAEGGGGGDGQTTSSLCAKYGGFANVQAISKGIFDAVKADCKISAYFTNLALTDEKHFQDCLANQIGEIMQCDGKVYEGSKDTLGGDCLPMAQAHQQIDPGIHKEDFDAFLIDMIGVFKAKGVSSDDVGRIAPTFNSMQGDVQQTDDPGNAQSLCPGADAGQDTGTDAGKDAAQDTGTADADDAG